MANGRYYPARQWRSVFAGSKTAFAGTPAPEKKKKPKRIEDEIQAQCVEWFRRQFPKLVLFAIPNGARTSISVAVRLKKTGLLKGTPDLLLARPIGQWSGLFVEMKAPGGSQSPEQKALFRQLTAAGYACTVCKSLEQFMTTIHAYMLGAPGGFA